MIRRLAMQLPVWARPAHPILRYGLKPQPLSRRARYARALSVILLLLVMGGVGYILLLATNFPKPPPGQNLTETLLDFVFWPALILQIFTRLAVQTLTVNTVSDEKRRQTWDSLRATEHGAELTLRTRWASVFYRMRGLLGLILLVRLVLIFGILFDLTAFRGGYLDRLVNGIVPDIPLLVGALLLAFMMTASLLLPLTGIGFDAAVGLLISTRFHQRTYAVLTQVVIAVVRIALVAGLIYGMSQFTAHDANLPDGVAWLLMAAFAAMGDWGLVFLQLGFFGDVWANVPYGIFISLGLLVFAMLQAGLTDGILALAIRRAERSG